MSDEKDTAASPDAEVEETQANGATEEETAEEETPLTEEELEEQAAAKAEADAKAAEQFKLRDENVVMVRHLGRNKKSRTLRASRAGRRRQGFILGDGTRIRKHARRSTPVGFDKLLANANRFMEGVITGVLEIRKPNSDRPMELGEFQEFIMEVADDMEFEIKWERERLEPLERLAPTHQIEPVSGPVPAIKGRSTEITRETDESALLAAVDQHDAEMTGEANTPSSETETGAGEVNDETETTTEGTTTEETSAETSEETSEDGTGLIDDEGEEVMTLDSEELMKLTRSALNEMAESEQFGVENPEKLSNKEAVIEAIFDSAKEQE